MFVSAENYSFPHCVHRGSTYFLECISLCLWVSEIGLQVFIFSSGLLLCHHEELSSGIRPVPRTSPSVFPTLSLSLYPFSHSMCLSFHPNPQDYSDEFFLLKKWFIQKWEVCHYLLICWYFFLKSKSILDSMTVVKKRQQNTVKFLSVIFRSLQKLLSGEQMKM